MTAALCFDTTKLCHCSPKVFLLPSVLARKRVWNPKYPICIQLAGGANSQGDEGGRLDDSFREEPGAEAASPRQTSSKHPSHDPPTTLYLFGRTGREKEEWFRHFLFASTDAERDKQRPGRCASRSGTSNVNNALEKRRLPDKASIQLLYVWIMDYMLQFFAFQSQSLLREHTDLTVDRANASENIYQKHQLCFEENY